MDACVVDVEPAFFTQAEVARLLGVPERTLEGWRLTKSGPPSLRSFIEDNDVALRALGVDVDHYSTQMYRRTVATLIERSAGLTIASRLLGHANEMVTRSSYVVAAEQVDIVTADILDTILGA